MTMTVGQLMEMLEGLDSDMEVRFASQPSYPFEYDIENVYVVDMLGDEDEPPRWNTDEVECDEQNENEGGKFIVYLAEGSQIGYLPGIVAQTIGWR